MRSVVPHTARHFGRAVIMPNLVPPVTTAAMAKEYRQRIQQVTAGGFILVAGMALYCTLNRPVAAARRGGCCEQMQIRQ